jgi:hypothetical protein
MTSSSGLRRGVILKPLTGRHVVARCGCIRLRGGGSCRRAAAKKAAQSARPRCQSPVAYELLGHAGILPPLGTEVPIQVLRINSHDMRPSGEAQRPSPICADRRNGGPGFTRHRVLAALVMVALPVALRWRGPWKPFSRTTFDETLPPGAQTVWLGQFASRIHRTSGTVRLVTLLDGEQILRIENLHTRRARNCAYGSVMHVGRLPIAERTALQSHGPAVPEVVVRVRNMGSTSPC